MLRIISCVLIGRYFSQLAFDHNKNRWGVGILAGFATLVVQLIIEFIIALFFLQELESGTGMGAALIITILGMTLGTLVMVFVYQLFKKNWERQKDDRKESSNLLDS